MIDEIHENWRKWDSYDGYLDDHLTFNNFYDGFMKPYFGCYRCPETEQALNAINVVADGKISWDEFEVFLKWAGHQYPKTETDEDLLEIAFLQGIIPAMQIKVIDDNDNGTKAENVDKDTNNKETVTNKDFEDFMSKFNF